jgi:teichuronic acid biosynthesis glycosyltransferase TuaC
MTMLNVLVISKRQYTHHDLLDDRYGRIREIPLNLALRGHRVAGICLSYRPRREGRYRDYGVEWQSINAGIPVIPGLAQFAWATSRQLKTSDVLWACSDSLFGIIGYFVSRRLKKPLVFDLYDNFESFALARWPVFKALYTHAVRRCAAVTAVSRPLLDLVRSYGRRDGIYLLENAVDQTLFFPHNKATCRSELGLPQNAHLIGTAGSLTRNRGVEALYAAFHELALKHPDVHLVIAGPRDVLVPVHPRIHDMGLLGYDRVPTLLGALDVGVICNRASAFGTYCFPQKAREKMACKVPVVAADVSGTRSLFSANPEWLFQPADPVHLARVIERRIENPSTDYGPVPSWPDMAELLERVFLNLTDGRR